MSYSERVGQFHMRVAFRPEGAQTFEALTPLHLIAAPTLDRLPSDIASPLRREFYARNDASKDWAEKYAAQDWLAGEVEKFEGEKLHVAFDEQEINDRAKRWADLCSRMVVLEDMQEIARERGIAPPEPGKRITRVGAVKRLQCPRWWRRQLRKTWTRRAESHLRAVGMVHRRKQVYASDRCVQWRKQRKARNAAVLRELVAVSDAGDQLNLFDVSEKSLSNPALRRAELMTRMHGFETLAEWAGHGAIFVTGTTPSAFHATHSTGERNEKYTGAAPSDAQAWLCKVWARVRSALSRVGVSVYGFRVAEPHHDGTPHWHMVLFGMRRALLLARRAMARAWRKEHREDFAQYKSGAWRARFDCKVIDKAKGSATGYIATYVAKNIDGYQVGEDYEAKSESKTACDRVAAWASAHSIRQFQQIGGPSVSLWRELRRLRDTVCDHQAIEAARVAADAGDWAQFVVAVGGIAAGRNTQLALWKEDTGELNQYDEMRAAQVVGVEYTGGAVSVLKARRDIRATEETRDDVPAAPFSMVRTRTKGWRIQRKAEGAAHARCDANQNASAREVCGIFSPLRSSLGPVSITVRDIIAPSGRYSWIYNAPPRGRIRSGPP